MITRKPRIFYGYIVILAGTIASAFMIGTYTSFGIFFKPISSELGWTRATTSVAGSVAALVTGFFGILAGRVTDKYGPKLVLIASGFLFGIGNFLMSQISTPWHLYMFYGVLLGAGMSAADIPIVTTIARWFVKRRGMMTGITKAGAGVGLVSMPLLLSWLISTRGWRDAYAIIGIVAAVGIVSMALLFKRDPSKTGELPDGAINVEVSDSSTITRHFSLREAMETRQLWLFSAAWVSFMFVMQVVMIHIANYVTDVGLSAATAAAILSVIGGFSILGRLGLASLSDILGTKSAYLIAFSFLATALLWLQFARQTWMFYLFGAIYGTAHGACFALIAPLVAGLFGVQSLGSILSVIFLIGTLGAIISPMLAGRIFDIMGNYQLAFWLCFAMSIVGIVLILLLRPTNKGGTNEP